MNLYANELTNKEILDHKPFRWKSICMDMDLLKVKHKKINKINIVWKDVEFLKKNKTEVPSSQGIYMFVLDVSNGLNLYNTSKYILYVGQTINLKSRFNSYFGYENSDEPSDFLKRCMVLIWKRKLDFYFFETKNLTAQELTMVEFDIIDSVVPPINQRFRGRVLKKKIKLYSPR